MKQRVSHQLRMADVVVVNKTDLVEGEFPAIEQEIKTINPFAIIQESCNCDIDFEFGNSAIKKFYFDEVKTMPYPISIRWGLKF